MERSHVRCILFWWNILKPTAGRSRWKTNQMLLKYTIFSSKLLPSIFPRYTMSGTLQNGLFCCPMRWAVRVQKRSFVPSISSPFEWHLSISSAQRIWTFLTNLPSAEMARSTVNRLSSPQPIAEIVGHLMGPKSIFDMEVSTPASSMLMNSDGGMLYSHTTSTTLLRNIHLTSGNLAGRLRAAFVIILYFIILILYSTMIGKGPRLSYESGSSQAPLGWEST